MKLYRVFLIILFICFALIVYENLTAFSDGFVGLTKRNGNTVGCICHNLNADTDIKVNILGPSVVSAGDTVDYQIKLSGGPAVAGGIDISADSGEVFTHPADTSLKLMMAEVMELTHRYPKPFVQDTVTWLFRYFAPNIQGSTDTIFATGNSVNNDQNADTADGWNFAGNKVIQINPVLAKNVNTLIKNFELLQNYPNPFNPVTTIGFNLREASSISLLLYDIKGKQITKLISNAKYNPGSFNILINAEEYSLSSGVYFYRLVIHSNLSEDSESSEIKKLVLLK